MSVRESKGGVQVVFPGGTCAIYRAESVSWDRRTGTLTLKHSGRSSVFEHWGASLQVTAWRWVDGSIRDRTWRVKTGYGGRF